MWIFFSVAVPRNILGAVDPHSPLYERGLELARDCFAQYNFVGFIAAIAFLWVGRLAPAKWIHVVCLTLGGLGLTSLLIAREPWMLIVAFTGVGIAWASILSMPYAMLSSALPPERMGVYMGIFNFFIVIPQILIAVVLSRVMENYPGVNRLTAVVFGGICLLIAALVTMLVPTTAVAPRRLQRAAEEEGMMPSIVPPESPLE
jgi:maltose/moltooligosaccharide transporter